MKDEKMSETYKAQAVRSEYKFLDRKTCKEGSICETVM
jgi:hypothetical protein